jgi:hypothetical protein
VRLVLLRGEQLGYQGAQAWGCEGPYEVEFHRGRIAGRTDGPGRFLYLSTPAGLDRLPVLVLDGQTWAMGTAAALVSRDAGAMATLEGKSYAPETAAKALIVPLLPGEHRFEIRVLEQPPVWRDPQAW